MNFWKVKYENVARENKKLNRNAYNVLQRNLLKKNLFIQNQNFHKSKFPFFREFN